ncbi:MAG: ribokinase [Clostridia bacterium]|nr:ribokinase [Clostridia bacterium]
MIYVLGSINMDMVAQVDRIPKIGETLGSNKFYVNQGGKGANQAVAIAKLGGNVKMIGKVGNDANGQFLLSSLSSNGVDIECVSVADANSGIAMIAVENGDNRIIFDAGANSHVTEGDVDIGLADASENDILIMQLEIPMEIVEYASSVAKEKGMTVILNPAPAKSLSPLLLQNVDIIAPNESETKILTDIEVVDEVHLTLAVRALYKTGVKKVVVTMGEKGSAVAEGQTITYIEPRKVNAVDTTSAGDTFIGALALCLAQGKGMVESAQFASVASSVTVTREGAAQSIPTLSEVKEIMESEK